MTEITNLRVWLFGILNFEFVCDSVLVVCDFYSEGHSAGYNFSIAFSILFKLSSFPKISAKSKGGGLCFLPERATRKGHKSRPLSPIASALAVKTSRIFSATKSFSSRLPKTSLAVFSDSMIFSDELSFQMSRPFS